MEMINLERATEAAKKYCTEHGYNSKKIDRLYKQMLGQRLCFAYFPNKNTNGLSNDLDTRAVPLLFVNENYNVTEQEEAKKILGAEQ